MSKESNCEAALETWLKKLWGQSFDLSVVDEL
jgi:hypothetical protein